MRSSSTLRTRGSMLLEATVAVGIGLMTLVASLTAFSYLYRLATANTAHVQAAYLAEEGLEAVRLLRDDAWSNISSQTSGATTYLAFSGTTWSATSTNASIDQKFERAVVFTNVYRDANQDIAASGTEDANTKKVTVTVSWQGRNGTSSVSLATYIANVFNE